MTLSRWQKRFLEVLVIIAVIGAIQWYKKRELISGMVPPFVAMLTDDRVFDSSSMAGRPYVLHFWASWCPVCRFEQDTIQSLSQDYPVITVAMQSGDAQDVGTYLAEEGLDFITVLDETGALARRFGVRGVPTTMIINSQGEIAFSEVGYTTEWGLRLRLWLTD